MVRIRKTEARRFRSGACRLAIAVGLLIAFSASAVAADAASEAALIATGMLTALLVLLIFFIVFVLDGNIDAFVRMYGMAWNYLIPKSTDQAIDLGHDFDGIRELDNRIPPWFNYLFIATIIFSIIYAVNYHLLGTSPLPTQEYQQELAAADLAHRLRIAGEGEINEAALAILADPASIKEGGERFQKFCISCHGAKGEGLVGPNLTDAYWINGGGITNVFATIKNGVPAKGMISWKLVFTPKEIQQLASFVLTLQGTNPPNGKKPEGTLYVEPRNAAVDSSARKKT